MPAHGTPNFNTIVVATISADFRQGGQDVAAEAAYVNSDSGETYGWTKGTGPTWSERTKRHLAELRESMEQDLAAQNFKGGTPGAPRVAEPSGLGEHLSSGSVDAPQA